MAKQVVKVELYYDGVWNDITALNDVLTSTPITIQRGDGEESAAPRPSQILLTLANDDDRYRITNPTSPLYGKAGVNTPIRVSVGGVVRGIGEVASWSAEQTPDFRTSPRRGNAWVDIEAYGLLGRINQWSDKVQSTMVKGMLSFTDDLIGVWPLEDESTSTILSQLVAGGTSGTYSGDVTLGDSERPAGSARSVKLGSGGRFGGTFIRSTNSGWQISFAMKLPALPGSATYEEVFTWSDSTGRRWTWEVNNANFGWTVYSGDGTVLASLAASYTGREPNQWIRYRMKVTVSGATITYEPAWYVEGSTTEAGTSGTFAGTATGYLKPWAAVAATYNAGAWYTGVFGLNDTTAVIFNAGVKADFNGRPGETPGNRFVRVMGDLGLSYATNGTLSKGMPMGPQPAETLAEILREVRDTDDAVLFESKAAINVILTTRDYRYNQTPALTLDATANPTGMPALPREVTDDLPIHNIVTAAQRDGGSYTATDSTSVMGTQAPPNGRGEYKQQVDVNVYDVTGNLPQQANWWLRRGTVNLPRFPQLTVDLTSLSAAKILEVEAVTIGSVIEITNYREYTIRLFVVGYKETIGTHTRSIVFTCAPDQQFQVGVWDSATSMWDLRTSTLSAAVASADVLAFPVTTDTLEAWSRTGCPYPVMISGQKNTVLGCSRKNVVQTVDSSFELGTVGDWYLDPDGSASTFAASTAVAPPAGTYSALITCVGAPGHLRTRPTAGAAVVAAGTYQVITYVRCSVARNVDLEIDWLDGGGGYLSSSSSSIAVSAGVWTEISATFTAPASSATGYHGVTMTGSPAAGTLLYIKWPDLIRTDILGGKQVMLLTRGTNGITKALASGDAVSVATPGRWAL